MTGNLSIETESAPTANPVMAQPCDVPADSTMLSAVRKARRQRANSDHPGHATRTLELDPTINKLQIFQSVISLMTPGRLLDLGAGRGNFSLAAAHLGWTVTAVDARTMRLPDPLAVDDATVADLIRAVRWVEADVREFPIQPGAFDLICILGLLHHLEVPDQRALLARCATMPTLIDTRTVPDGIDRIDGYEGAINREHGETREERDLVPTAAWGNALSFRHTEASLLRLVRDCGYAKMMQMRPAHRRNYTFYLCLPQPEKSAKRMVAKNPRGPQREDGVHEPDAGAL